VHREGVTTDHIQKELMRLVYKDVELMRLVYKDVELFQSLLPITAAAHTTDKLGPPCDIFP